MERDPLNSRAALANDDKRRKAEAEEKGSISSVSVEGKAGEKSGIISSGLEVANAPPPNSPNPPRPLILITDSNLAHHQHLDTASSPTQASNNESLSSVERVRSADQQQQLAGKKKEKLIEEVEEEEEEEEEFEIIDGIRYRIIAAVTKPSMAANQRHKIATKTGEPGEERGNVQDENKWPKQQQQQQQQQQKSAVQRKLTAARRKSSTFVTNLIQSASLLGQQSHSNSNSNPNPNPNQETSNQPARRMSIYELTKSPPPETSLEIYLSERRRSSTISAKQVQQQLEQQSTFETNYCQRQRYFKDLNQKLINHDKKLLNVVANRGQIHRHSVDIAQLPLHLAQAKASKTKSALEAEPEAEAGPNATNTTTTTNTDYTTRLKSTQDLPWRASNDLPFPEEETTQDSEGKENKGKQISVLPLLVPHKSNQSLSGPINQSSSLFSLQLAPNANRAQQNQAFARFSAPDQDDQDDQDDDDDDDDGGQNDADEQLERQAIGARRLAPIRSRISLLAPRGSLTPSQRSHKKSRIVIRKFQKLDLTQLHSTPAPDVKIGQRVAYKEYYGNEFGTIRWIGRVPQICPDWTAGIEFDNAIGEGDGSLNGRRYFIAKDCFAKFLPLNDVAFVDQHVGRPEPGTMISVMSAAVRPGQMISIQRVSTVHVQHCFLNAPHQIPGADILAVNSRLHCQCPNCGPCAHVIKPPRTQRLSRSRKNATHMCQFSTYTCCGMESQEEALCTYTGNKASAALPPPILSSAGLPPIGNSWIEGSGYLTSLQAYQSKQMPEEYRLGASPEDIGHLDSSRRRLSRSSRRNSGRKRHRNNRNNSITPTDDHKSEDQYLSFDFKESAQARVAEDANLLQSCQQMTTTTTTTYTAAQFSPPHVNEHQGQFSPMNNTGITYSGELLDPIASDQNDYHKSINWLDGDQKHVDSNVHLQPPQPKNSKIIHRDSIENRYLFPTDDIIDSALEADLDNLSQARYGYNSSANLRLNASRNIFKSLRSLVSCLGAQSNQSVLERRSNNTVKFSGQPMQATNKSQPSPVTALVAISHIPDGNRSLQFDDSTSNAEKSNDMKDNHFQGEQNAASIDHKQQLQSSHRHLSSSSDCGFSSASQNSINFQSSYHACSPIKSPTEDEQTNKIYKRIVTRLMNSTSLKSEDLAKLRKILIEPHSGNCCLHNNSHCHNLMNTVEYDEVIANVIQRSFFHSNKGPTTLNYHDQVTPSQPTICCHTNHPSGTTETSGQQNLGKMIDTIDSEMSANQCQIGNCHGIKAGSTPRTTACCSSASESVITNSHDSMNGCNESPGDNSFPNEKSRNRDMADENRYISDNASLPKAFELKLTLSINSEQNRKTAKSEEQLKKSSESLVEEVSTQDRLSSKLGVSNFNINIKSSLNDDEISKTVEMINNQVRPIEQDHLITGEPESGELEQIHT